MPTLASEARAFARERRAGEQAARHMAALRLTCGVDLAAALAETGPARRETLARLRRAMERERLKGAAGRPDYDLDRHIALSEALARFTEGTRTAKGNGARRRRR